MRVSFFTAPFTTHDKGVIILRFSRVKSDNFHKTGVKLRINEFFSHHFSELAYKFIPLKAVAIVQIPSPKEFRGAQFFQCCPYVIRILRADPYHRYPEENH